MKGTDRKGPKGTTIVLNIPAPNKLRGNKKQASLLLTAYEVRYSYGQ